MKQHKPFFEPIHSYIDSLKNIEIPDNRRKFLNILVEYILRKRKNKNYVNLVFVCTHNSRRSHLSQIWAQVLASYFDLDRIYCYSGGTKVTRVHSSIIKVLSNVGFRIESNENLNNPIFFLRYSDSLPVITGFSKRFNDHFNPKKDFASIMTCTDADKNCPIIGGCDIRISLPYKDPKRFDKTAEEIKKYEERMLQIATEMYYVFYCVNGMS